jgi:hypothetical protein
MRKRLLLLVAPLCVVAIAASVAVASPSDAEKLRGPRLDELHAERPIAALQQVDAVVAAQAEYDQVKKNIQDIITYKQLTDYLGGLWLDAYNAAASEAVVQAAAPRPVVSTVSSDSNPGDFLSCVRQRESGGDYGVYNSGGSGAAGAYQFMPGTWNGIAASSGRSDLVGVDPAQAAPADQDAMAQALYAQQGAAPWGGGCG